MKFKKHTATQEQSGNSLRGDTIIEVVLAISIFSIIAVSSVSIMNSGLSYAQYSLELTMARNLINQQTEAIRYIQNGFVAELEQPREKWQYAVLWHDLVDNAVKTNDPIFSTINLNGQTVSSFEINNLNDCEDAYNRQVKNKDYAFVINPRFTMPKGIAIKNGNSNGSNYEQDVLPEVIIRPSSTQYSKNGHSTTYIMQTANVYPRMTYGFLYIGSGLSDANYGQSKKSNNDEQLGETETGVNANSVKQKNPIYRRLETAEGIWVIPVRGQDESRTQSGTVVPEYYDFYVRTCWNGVGQRTHSTLTTIIRLYNPEIMEVAQ